VISSVIQPVGEKFVLGLNCLSAHLSFKESFAQFEDSGRKSGLHIFLRGHPKLSRMLWFVSIRVRLGLQKLFESQS
jgi:hypothetical protein